jgi:hypothetical protein
VGAVVGHGRWWLLAALQQSPGGVPPADQPQHGGDVVDPVVPPEQVVEGTEHGEQRRPPGDGATAPQGEGGQQQPRVEHHDDQHQSTDEGDVALDVVHEVRHRRIAGSPRHAAVDRVPEHGVVDHADGARDEEKGGQHRQPGCTEPGELEQSQGRGHKAEAQQEGNVEVDLPEQVVSVDGGENTDLGLVAVVVHGAQRDRAEPIFHEVEQGYGHQGCGVQPAFPGLEHEGLLRC